MEGTMSIFDIFRKPSPTVDTDVLKQIMQDQRVMLSKIEQLTLQIESLKQSGVRTSISTPIKTIVAPYEDPQATHILQFLQQRGINVRTVPNAQEYDGVFNEMATLMGNKYYNIIPLLEQIKKNMQKGSSFWLNIAQSPQQAIADMTLVCNKLHELTLLRDYLYKKAPQYNISARPSNEPRAQNFFSGQWLERYIAQMMRQFASDAWVTDFEILTNPQIIMPNGDDFELDVLVHLNGRIYWIETKTGHYQDHIGKYSKFAELLNLPTGQSVMVLPDANTETTFRLSLMFKMKVMNLSDANEYFLAEFVKR
jgi:hypothetical protein